MQENKTFKLKGGGQITASSNEDLVLQLMLQGFINYKSKELYMKATSHACKIQNGSKIRFDTIDNFVEDLINNNFLEVEND